MPEFRQNLATKEWVVLATERGKRPSDFTKERPPRTLTPPFKDDCPFCPGHEDKTPAPMYIFPDKGDWQVRVVPNRFAALQPNLATTRSSVGRFLSAKGFGIAEVVIESPKHNLTIATMNITELGNVLLGYRARLREISKNDKINLITIFRNHGPLAGTSLEHPHSQIIATPIVPPHVRYPMEQAVLHFDKHGTCVYCDMVKEEIEQQERVIAETDYFVAFCPYAARSPFECRIYPKRHKASFSAIDGEEVMELAALLRELLARIDIGLNNPDYNYVLRSSPVGDEDTRHLHWYIVIIPKITIPAGFEIGSGIYINTVAPEDSARFLREVEVK